MKKLLFVLVCAAGLVSCDQQKTAYVDNVRLLQDYQEMKDVEADFTERSTRLSRELDSIAQVFQSEVQAYQQESANMSAAEREAAEGQLMQRQQMLRQQQQVKSGALREESDAAVDTLVTKVKDYVKEYGKENNYTYIFGSNETANIMYAEEGLDITEEILEKINADYKNN